MFFCNIIYGGRRDPEELSIGELSEDVLFVGLGSHCEAADTLRGCGVRKAAFPFDWILSSDGEKLIEILEDDFLFFTEERYMTPIKRSNMVLVHSYYNIEFHHEGEWRGGDEYLIHNMETLILKYRKRVERFRQLKSFGGKVFFIRFANKYALESNVFYRFRENLEITDEYSVRLHSALKKYFPLLDFYLIIVNIHDGKRIEEEKRLLDNLLMIRSNPRQSVSIKTSDYRDFFNKLMASE